MSDSPPKSKARTKASTLSFKEACARLGLDPANPDLRANLQGAFQRSLQEARVGDILAPPAHYRELLEAYRRLRAACAPADPTERRFHDWPSHIELTPEEAIRGGLKTGRLLTGRPFTTKLPPGLRDGDVVWVWGWLIQVRIDAGGDLAVRGDDIWMTARKPESSLRPGARVSVETPMGAWSFRLSDEAVERRLVRVPGAGMPAARHHAAGDLYVRLEAEPDRGPVAMIRRMVGLKAS
jgi:curved DNA-binding protein